MENSEQAVADEQKENKEETKNEEQKEEYVEKNNAIEQSNQEEEKKQNEIINENLEQKEDNKEEDKKEIIQEKLKEFPMMKSLKFGKKSKDKENKENTEKIDDENEYVKNLGECKSMDKIHNNKCITENNNRNELNDNHKKLSNNITIDLPILNNNKNPTLSTEIDINNEKMYKKRVIYECN